MPSLSSEHLIAFAEDFFTFLSLEELNQQLESPKLYPGEPKFPIEIRNVAINVAIQTINHREEYKAKIIKSYDDRVELTKIFKVLESNTVFNLKAFKSRKKQLKERIVKFCDKEKLKDYVFANHGKLKKCNIFGDNAIITDYQKKCIEYNLLCEFDESADFVNLIEDDYWGLPLDELHAKLAKTQADFIAAEGDAVSYYEIERLVKGIELAIDVIIYAEAYEKELLELSNSEQEQRLTKEMALSQKPRSDIDCYFIRQYPKMTDSYKHRINLKVLEKLTSN